MRGRSTFVAAAAWRCSALAPPALASGGFSDVPHGFWARPQIRWAADNLWMAPRTPTTFVPHHTASRVNASRVLTRIAFQLNGVPQDPDPFAQAVAAGWIPEGSGPSGTITQLEFDRGLVRVLGLSHAAKALNHLTTADGWAPKLPDGFGVEQEVRAIGARTTSPTAPTPGSWLRPTCCAARTWPPRPTGDAHVAVALAAGQAKVAVATRLPGMDRRSKQGARAGAPLRGRAVRLGRHLARPAVAARARRSQAGSTARASCGG